MLVNNYFNVDWDIDPETIDSIEQSEAFILEYRRGWRSLVESTSSKSESDESIKDGSLEEKMILTLALHSRFPLKIKSSIDWDLCDELVLNTFPDVLDLLVSRNERFIERDLVVDQVKQAITELGLDEKYVTWEKIAYAVLTPTRAERTESERVVAMKLEEMHNIISQEDPLIGSYKIFARLALLAKDKAFVKSSLDYLFGIAKDNLFIAEVLGSEEPLAELRDIRNLALFAYVITEIRAEFGSDHPSHPDYYALTMYRRVAKMILSPQDYEAFLYLPLNNESIADAIHHPERYIES